MRLASQRPVVIFSKSSCCMCHSIKSLFCNYGANPVVHELDQDPKGREIERALVRLGCNPAVPAVFIGGQFVGGVDKVLDHQVNGSLKPWLIRVGAIWV